MRLSYHCLKTDTRFKSNSAEHGIRSSCFVSVKHAASDVVSLVICVIAFVSVGGKMLCWWSLLIEQHDNVFHYTNFDLFIHVDKLKFVSGTPAAQYFIVIRGLINAALKYVIVFSTTWKCELSCNVWRYRFSDLITTCIRPIMNSGFKTKTPCTYTCTYMYVFRRQCGLDGTYEYFFHDKRCCIIMS